MTGHQRRSSNDQAIVQRLAKDSIEKAVHKIEFGRFMQRTKQYLNDAMQTDSRRESAMNRQETLSKMSLRRNDSGFSQAMHSGLCGWKDKPDTKLKQQFSMMSKENTEIEPRMMENSRGVRGNKRR